VRPRRTLEDDLERSGLKLEMGMVVEVETQTGSQVPRPRLEAVRVGPEEVVHLPAVLDPALRPAGPIESSPETSTVLVA
jgi:hypothetical protein